MKHTRFFIGMVLLILMGCERRGVQIRSLSEIDFEEYSIPAGEIGHFSELGESAKYYLEKYGTKRDQVLSGFVVTKRLSGIRIIVDMAGGMSGVWQTIIVSDSKMFVLAFVGDKLECIKESPLDKEARMTIEKVSEALVSSRGGFLDNIIICDRAVFFVTVYKEQKPAAPFVVDGFVDYSNLSFKVQSTDKKKYAIRPIPEQEKTAFHLLFGKIVNTVW